MAHAAGHLAIALGQRETGGPAVEGADLSLHQRGQRCEGPQRRCQTGGRRPGVGDEVGAERGELAVDHAAGTVGIRTHAAHRDACTRVHTLQLPVHRLDVCVRRHDEDVEIRRELGGVRRRGPAPANRDANGFARSARVGRGQPHGVRRRRGHRPRRRPRASRSSRHAGRARLVTRSASDPSPMDPRGPRLRARRASSATRVARGGHPVAQPRNRGGHSRAPSPAPASPTCAAAAPPPAALRRARRWQSGAGAPRGHRRSPSSPMPVRSPSSRTDARGPWSSCIE